MAVKVSVILLFAAVAALYVNAIVAEESDESVTLEHPVPEIQDAALKPKFFAGPTQTIVQIAVSRANLSTLVAAVQAAGLASALSGKGPFTVFAPTNAAFAKLPAGTVANLLKPAQKQALKNILLFHVVSGRVLGGSPFTTLNSATTKKLSAGITINGARVLRTDYASNGIIHTIDSVLLP